MAQLIAGLYEIQQEIGSGGGGVVYLGRHVRLDKTVVLKADKRSLTAKTETLRREVDLLKGLSHTYIPQVYDFLEEDGIVYTVMDFIDGESLDKRLVRKQIPTQPQVVGWACQLLDALVYLHGRPPHGILHGDIKPANIMLRPNGDICLIDYNIALALGEDGAVKVGFSRGYASPEHYGADYISANRPASVGSFTDTTANTRTRRRRRVLGNLAEERTVLESDLVSSSSTVPSSSLPGGGSTTSGKRGILLDVRSDIYSLGATLYHLISGKRPASDAREVVPLGAEVCSPAVSAILQKAMAPMPEDRYQSAEEMLNAFLSLYRQDIRMVRHKRRILASAAVLAVFFLLGGVSTFVGLKQMGQRQEALTLSEYSAGALAEGDVSRAISLALQAIPSGNSILEAPVTAQAQKALTDAVGVYDLSDGFKALDTVNLPGAPFDMAASPGGTRFAVVYAYEVAVFDTADYRQIAAFPTKMSALSDVVFVDESRIIYAGESGVTAYDLDAGAVLWTGEEANILSLSGDKKVLAAVNGTADHAVVYQVENGEKMTECYFMGAHLDLPTNDIAADAGNYIFDLNEDGRFLAVSLTDGGLVILGVTDPDNNVIVYETSDYSDFNGGFFGKYFVFGAYQTGLSSFGLIDYEALEYVGGFDSQDDFLLRMDERGIYLAMKELLVKLDADTLEQTELARINDTTTIKEFSIGEEYVLVTAQDGTFSFYDRRAHQTFTDSFGEKCDFAMLVGKCAVLGNRDKPLLRLLELEDHAEAELLSYDARYAHDEARLSQDGQTAMFFHYEGFRIYDRAGEILTEVNLPDAANMYDQQFRKTEEGSWLEVIWYDGTVRCYSAADGSLLSEEKGEEPDKELTQEFLTDKYRIVAPLHETPTVYDLKSGKQVAQLEKDAYLTYVTQLGNYLVTEYQSTEEGKEDRYGLLLDEKLETVAYLPNLCDIAGDELIFDDGAGNLRHSRLYSLQELMELGEAYIQ